MSTIGQERPAGRRATQVVSAEIGVWARIARMWRERQLLKFMVSRDLSVKYKNSALGFVWSLLNPALVLIVYVFVFQVVLKSSIRYFAVYLMCGLVMWNFFTTSVSTSCGSIVANSHLIKKVSFSREVLVLSSMGTAAVFWFFQVIILVVTLIVMHFVSGKSGFFVPVVPYAYLIPLALIALVMFTLALSVFFAAVNVFLRDVQHLLEVVLMAWFWGTPIVYSYGQHVAPHLAKVGGIEWLYVADPIVPIILLMQRALYGNIAAVKGVVAKGAPLTVGKPIVAEFPPHWYAEVFGVIIAGSFLLFLLALKLFGRLEGNFAEEL